MPESPNNITISQPGDPPITDSFGNAWRVSPSGHPTANGVLDSDDAPIMQIAFVNQMIWRQTNDLKWWSKRHPGDMWWPPGGTEVSPLNGQVNQEIGEIERAMEQVLFRIASLQRDFDIYKSQPPASIAPVLSAIGRLQADLDARGGNQKVLVDLLDQILAGQAAAGNTANANQAILVRLLDQIQAANLPVFVAVIDRLNAILSAVNKLSAPTMIMLDIAGGTHIPQPIPSREGP